VLRTSTLIANRRRRWLGPMAHRALRYLSAMEVPSSVEIGPDLTVYHNGFGVVLHHTTVIGARVHLFHGVTVGRADVTIPAAESTFEGIVIEDDVFLCAGAKVLGKEGTRLTVGRGTVVAANAVLLESTGPWEIWGGVPARLIGKRTPPPGDGRDGVGRQGPAS
jgi:serine O-acetyltransferase